MFLSMDRRAWRWRPIISLKLHRLIQATSTHTPRSPDLPSERNASRRHDAVHFALLQKTLFASRRSGTPWIQEVYTARIEALSHLPWGILCFFSLTASSWALFLPRCYPKT